MSTLQLCIVENKIVDATGIIDIRSALHNGRRFEYPLALQQIGWSNMVYKSTINSYVADFKRAGRRALDAGGGLSSFPFLLSKCYDEVYNVDNFSKEYIDLLETVKSKTGFSNIFLVIRNISSLPYDNDFFDDTFCISVLEHGKNDYGSIIDELLRVTKNRVIITVDVCNEKIDEHLSMADLRVLSKKYGFNIPSEEKAILLRTSNKETYFMIFCLCFDKTG
jgi:ubiquinone/menaquinone biosynthesis C-methylase UbiE